MISILSQTRAADFFYPSLEVFTSCTSPSVCLTHTLKAPPESLQRTQPPGNEWPMLGANTGNLKFRAKGLRINTTSKEPHASMAPHSLPLHYKPKTVTRRLTQSKLRPPRAIAHETPRRPFPLITYNAESRLQSPSAGLPIWVSATWGSRRFKGL